MKSYNKRMNNIYHVHDKNILTIQLTIYLNVYYRVTSILIIIVFIFSNSLLFHENYNKNLNYLFEILCS